jgi:type VI secretion system protein ImpM
MLSGLSHHLTQRWLAQSPHIWGKLPSHGDYLHYRASPAQAQGLKSWIDKVWHLRPLQPRPSGLPSLTAKSTHDQAGWMQLDAPIGQADLSAVPVAFVLPPGTLTFSPKLHVQGVMIPSEDKIGRACPFIIFQQVSRSWMARTWAQDNTHHVDVAPGQHLLYWWARVAARMHGTESDFAQCCQAVDAVWQHHAPGWPQLMGGQPAALTFDRLEHALGTYLQRDEADAAWGLQGVQQLPWRNWPERAWSTPAPKAAFWQQDMRGAYVNAADNLLDLWGVR